MPTAYIARQKKKVGDRGHGFGGVGLKGPTRGKRRWREEKMTWNR